MIQEENKNNRIEYLELSAGRGKTYSTIKWIVENQIPKGEKYVYIAPSKDLINETAKLVFDLGYEDFTVITDEYYKGVLKSTLDILPREDSQLYLITHANLENILMSKEEWVFGGFNIVIDELPNIFNMHDYQLNSKIDFIKERLVCKEGFEDNPTYSLKRSKGMLESLINDSKKNASPKITSFAKALLYTDTVVTQENSESVIYQTYTITNYEDFMNQVKRVIVLAAKVTDTLFSSLLKRQGVVFEEFTDVVPTRPTYQNQERVKIYYLTDEKVTGGCTSSILNSAYNIKTGKKLRYKDYRHLPNGVDDLGEGFINVYQEYVDRACAVLGEDFIYTVNYKRFTKEYKEVKYNGEDYGYCVPYGCHGLNKYSHITKALSIFCYKPSPLHKKLLNHLSLVLDYPAMEKEYVDLKMKDASYQLCMRTKLRDYSDTTSEIIFVVPDVEVANYIREEHIPNCKIDNSIALYIPDNRENNGGHNKDTLTKAYGLTKKQNQSFRSWKTYFKKSKGVDPTEEQCITKINKLKGKANE